MGRAFPLASLAKRVTLQGRELFFQRDAEERARARDPKCASYIAECVRGVDRRLEFLGAVSDPDVAIAAAPLLRDVTIMLLSAESAGAGGAAAMEQPLDAEQELRRVCERLGVPSSKCDAGLRLLATDDPVAVDRMAPDDLTQSALALEQIARSLRARLDGRSIAEIVWSRRVRVAAALLVAVYGLFVAGRSLLSPSNLARRRAVTLSSFDAKGAPASALVDGVRSGTATATSASDIVLTNKEATPWALIDLGRPIELREVRIYNRDDGHYDDGLPYVVEVSADAEGGSEVGRCTKHFGSWWGDPPCSITLHETARYVRVRASNYLALSEIEVFAW